MCCAFEKRELGVLALMTTSNLAQQEVQQLQRTIEMFRAITESQPDDYQSLEILKEAYSKLGRLEEALAVSKKLAVAYVSLGQIAQAILEYEGILQERPDDSSARAALAELESKTSNLGSLRAAGAPSPDQDSKPKTPAGVSAGVLSSSSTHTPDDGDRELANILVADKIVSQQLVSTLLHRLQTERTGNAERGQPMSLVQMIADEQIAKLEDILIELVDKSALPYMPLSVYDVERDICCLLPKDVCFTHCIIPFDLISRSLLIATANPFDAAAREQVEALVDYSTFWYVASPQEITAALRKAYGLDTNAGRPDSVKPAQGKQ